MPTFNYQKAIDAGYTPEQIDAFVKKNNLTVRKIQSPVTGSDMQQAQAPTPQPQIQPPQSVKQPTFNERVGQGIRDIGKNILSPFVRTGRNIAGGLVQAPLAIRAGDLANVVNNPNASDEEKDKALKELRRVNQLNRLMAPFAETGKATDAYKQDAGQVLSDPRITKQARDSINIASYGVPFGKGSGILTKAILPGAAVGAMQEASQDDATLTSTLGGAATGGLLSGATYAATKIPSLLKSFGKGTQQVGDKLVQSQLNVPRSTATNLKLPETISALNRYGYSKVDKIAGGADDVIKTIDGTIQSTVSKSKPVKMDGFGEVVKDIVGDPSLAVGKDEKILKFIDKMVQKLTGGGKGSQIRYEADPNTTLEVIRTLQKKAADVAKGKLPAAITDEERALKQAYRLIADELEMRLYEGAGADKLVVGELPKLVGLLEKFSPELAKDASKVTTIGELRSLMAPFVRGKIAAETTELGRNLATETMGGAIRGVGKLVQNPLNILAMPLGSDLVNSGTGNIIGKTGRVLQASPQLPQQISNVSANVASRFPSIVNPNDTVNNPAQDSQTNNAYPTQEQEGGDVQGQVDHTIGNINQMATDINTNPKDIKGSSGYSYNELTRAFAKAMMEGDTKLANRIKPLIEIEKDALADTKKTNSLSSTQKTRISEASIGEKLLDDLTSELNKKKSKIGPIRGKISSVNVYDTDAQVFQSQIKAAAQVIGRAMEGGVLRKEDIPKYEAILPKIDDTLEVSLGKIEKVKKMLKYQKLFLMNSEENTPQPENALTYE
jgi:hypothetical protein